MTGTGLASLGTISKGLSATFGGISNALGSIAKALDTSNGNLSQLSATLASANISLSGTKDAITDMRGVIGGRLERLNQMKGEEGYEILSKLLAHDPEEIGSFMASRLRSRQRQFTRWTLMVLPWRHSIPCWHSG